MNKLLLSLWLTFLGVTLSFAAKPLVEWAAIPKPMQVIPKGQLLLYYKIHNNTNLNLPLNYRFSNPKASIATEQSTCANNLLPASGTCTLAVSYPASNHAQTIPFTISVYYRGRGPLVNTTPITINQNLACSLLKTANWQSSFCQMQYQNALTYTDHVFNVTNTNVQQEQSLGGVLGVYQLTNLGEQICYISCGQRALNGLAPDENTLFELASVSKLFTGSVLGTLVASQRINPLETISNYLPSNTWDGKSFKLTAHESQVSFQQLATFSGGVCFSDAPSVDLTGINQTLNQANFVSDINKLDTSLNSCINQGTPQVKLVYGAPNYLPSHNDYSNSSIGLVAQALMNTDGYPNVLEGDFNGWLCNNITSVLDMPLTSGCLPDEAVNGNCPFYTLPNANPCTNHLWQQGQYASGYHINHYTYQLGNPFNYLPWAGAGGIRSNARDMIQFIRANLNISKSFTPAELALIQGMQVAQTANDYLPTPADRVTQANIGSQLPLKGSQGYAWVCETIQGLDICGKIGGHENFRSFVGINKSEQYGIVLLFNTGANSTTGSLLPIQSAIPTISTVGVNMMVNSNFAS